MSTVVVTPSDSGTIIATSSLTGFSVRIDTPERIVQTLEVQGPVGAGVQPGGNANDVLVKASATNYDTAWTDTPTVDGLQFDTAAGEEDPTTGLMVWNADEGTVDLGLNGVNNTFLHVGQESVYRVSNRTGSPIAKGQVCGFAGTIGGSGRLKVKLFDASSDPAVTVMGVSAEAIPNDADGYVVAFGKVRKVKTDYPGWLEEDILYADPATPGGLTRVLPSAPNAIVTVAALVTRAENTGELFVRPTFAPQLSETQDVLLSSPADGQVLTYDAVQGLWVNEDTAADAVTSVNGQVGAVVLDAADVGALGTATTTDGIAEGTANLYYTDVRAAAAAPVQSVNGAAGTVVLTTSDVAEGTALYYTDVRASAAAPVQSVNGGTGVVTITAASIGAYLDTNPAGYVDAVGAAAAAPVQSVNGAQGTVVLTTSDVAEGTALYYTDARASAAAPVQSVNGSVGTVTLDAAAVGAIGTATGLYVYDYGTAIPTVRPSALAVYWQGTAVPGTAISRNGDLWYDSTGD